jgi:hypothetical protein
MQQGLALLGAGSVPDTMVQIMAEQSKQTNERLEATKGSVKDKLSRLRAQTTKKLATIETRIQEQKNAAFWDKMTKVFQVIGATIAAVSSVVTGPAGLVAAGLLVAALIVSEASDSKAAQYVSLGLSIAGAAASLGAGVAQLASAGATASQVAASSGTVASSAATHTGSAAATVSQFGSATASAAGGGCTIAKSRADANICDANANLMELRARGKRLIKEAQEDRELMAELMDTCARCMKIATSVLRSNHNTALAAATGGA